MREDFGAFVPGTAVRIAGAPGGPLAGMRFAAKDLYDVAGHVTGGGNPDWGRTHPVPAQHAWAVEALLGAGAELIGKTISCEISLGILGFHQFFGTPDNPRAPGCMPGGSSSGSAAAVAGGLCDTALGTDSGGSVRVPASLCGLYGLRPTHGRISFAGGVVQSPSFDTPGWFARDADTFARVAAVMLGAAIPAAAPAPLLLAEDAFAACDPGIAEALRPAVARLEAVLGGAARRITLAGDELPVWNEQRTILQRAETWQTFKGWIDAVNPCFGFNVARNLANASAITPAQVAVGQVVRARVRDRARALLEGGAILCLPTTPFTAPPAEMPLHRIDDFSNRVGLLTSFAGLAGLPQLSLPLGEVGGKPIGVSIIAWRGGDERLVAIARALEA